MGKMVMTIAEKAGVECPKDAGKMKEDISCTKCKYYIRCTEVIIGVLF
ncbi:unnamed protein product [marine sediment metagenome]|uniref:Uncharacterized protein n=1 Tax=marine sediment metagenome TaxID=412755 RepID=X1CK78_9ZZZZ